MLRGHEALIKLHDEKRITSLEYQRIAGGFLDEIYDLENKLQQANNWRKVWKWAAKNRLFIPQDEGYSRVYEDNFPYKESE